MPVRVVSVITRLARGGSERRLYDVLRAVPAEHTVVVGADSESAVIETLGADHEVVMCHDLVRHVDPRRDARALANLAGMMRSRSPEIVHTHQSKAGLLGRVAARSARVPTVYHSASMASFGPGYRRSESGAFALAERATAPLVSRYFVVGTDLAARLVANGIAPRRLEIVRSSLDLRAFTPPEPGDVEARRATYGIAAGRHVVCYVGSLEDRKGVASLPDIAAAAAGSRGLTLLIAGDGPATAALAARASGGTDVEIRLLGHVSDVAGVMRVSDVLVLPSAAEGLPQVLVQAASCGLPFVAYDVDGVRELLALGAVGRVVPAGDQPGLIRAVAAELESPGRGEAAGPVDPAVWTAWDPHVVAEQYRRAYERDLGRPLDVGREDRLSE